MAEKLVYWKCSNLVVLIIMRKQQLYILGAFGIVIIAVIVILVLSLSGEDQSTTGGATNTSTLPERDSFITYFLNDLQGDMYASYDFSGTPQVVLSWTTECADCDQLIGDLATVQQEYPGHIQIIAINRGESTEIVNGFIEGIEGADALLYLLDPDSTAVQSSDSTSLQLFFVDYRGGIMDTKDSAVSVDSLRSSVEALIAEMPDSGSED